MMTRKAKRTCVLVLLGAVVPILLTAKTFQSISVGIGKAKNESVRPQQYFESPTNTPTTSGPEDPGQSASERQANPKASEALQGTHQNISTTTPLDLPDNISDLYKRLVVVTAYSSNHFREGIGIIASVQKYLPQTKILLYDIGLTAKQRSKASKYCNVEVRTFQFGKYPEHVQKLGTYAWKPLIIREVSQEYDVIMYGDSSLRVISPNIGKALACLLEFPFLDASPIPMPIISLTHNGTIDYLHFPPFRQHMATWGTVQAGCWLMLANDIMKEKVIQPWADCALHQECIAPAGASVTCHKNAFEREDVRYMGCHRFDQSALNIILAKAFGVQLFKKLKDSPVPGQVWKVERRPPETLSVVRTCM